MENERIEDKARLLVDSILLEPKVSKLVLQILEYDSTLYKHSLNVAYITAQICITNQFDARDMKDITTAALLHDIGKIKIPKDILLKKGSLSYEEFRIIKKHIEYGVNILKKNGFNSRIITYVETHHENICGTGYPNGVRDLTVGGKIIATVDKYDALTAKRCYGICHNGITAIQTILNEKSTETKYLKYIVLCNAI